MEPLQKYYQVYRKKKAQFINESLNTISIYLSLKTLKNSGFNNPR